MVPVMSRGRLDEFFELSARGSTLGAEIRGGVVTFIAMAYIVVLNPIILSERGRRRRQPAGLRAGLRGDIAGRGGR